jgi:hypothetical protein
MFLPAFLKKRRRIDFDDLSEMPDSRGLPPLDRPGLDPSVLSADQRSWVDNGVVIKKGFIPDTLLDPYIERRAAFRPGTRQYEEGWLDGNCYEGLPQLRQIALHPPLMALLQSLIGEPVLLHLALTSWISTERDWHQDDYLNPDFVNTWYAAVWIALDTIAPDSGPFEYVQSSHRWPLLRGAKVRGFLTDEELGRKEASTQLNQWPKYAERFVSPAIEDKIRTSGLPVLSFLPEKGDILVWHSRLMHRGSKPTKRVERRSLITHYSGVDHRPDMPLREQDENGHSFAVFKTSLTLD